MANTPISYDEIRLDVRHPELTQAYVFVRDMDGSFPIVRGWHHKTFPASMSTMDIMKAWADGTEDPLMWPLMAPPEVEPLNVQPDFRSRVISEFNNLSEKLLKLVAFCGTDAFQGLPTEEKQRLTEQEMHMANYADVLRRRIESFPA
jgi:hypothetical protein